MRRSGTDLAPCLHAHPVYVIDALGDDVEHTRRAQTLLMIERDHGHPWTGVSDFYQIASLPINYLGVTGHAFAQVRQSWPSGGALRRARQLRQRHHGNVELARQGLQRPRNISDFLLAHVSVRPSFD
jgi:hypothetical protein